jgi:hypothetical protein
MEESKLFEILNSYNRFRGFRLAGGEHRPESSEGTSRTNLLWQQQRGDRFSGQGGNADNAVNPSLAGRCFGDENPGP